MTFSDVMNDIEKLIGLELSSVRPGANITLLSVDAAKSCILLKTKQGAIRSRPISELQTIWEELIRNEAIHVEGVLHGSGTSRNQPETIFANLPYIEWLKVNNKKHITFVGKGTHPYGTLRQMDAMQAAELTGKISAKASTKRCVGVVVSDEIAKCTDVLQEVHAGSVTAVQQGVYRYETDEGYYLIASSGFTDVPNGTYVVFTSRKTQQGPMLSVGQHSFWMMDSFGLRILVEMI